MKVNVKGFGVIEFEPAKGESRDVALARLRSDLDKKFKKEPINHATDDTLRNVLEELKKIPASFMAAIKSIPEPIKPEPFPDQVAPIVNVPTQKIPAPIVNVPAPQVKVDAPIVNVPAPVVHIPERKLIDAEITITARDSNGRAKKLSIKEL